MKASLAQLGTGFIQPFARGTAMAGRQGKSQSHTGKPNDFPSSVRTRLFSKQLDCDNRAAYIPNSQMPATQTHTVAWRM